MLEKEIEVDEAGWPIKWPFIPFPMSFEVSGRYMWNRQRITFPVPGPILPTRPIPPFGGPIPEPIPGPIPGPDPVPFSGNGNASESAGDEGIQGAWPLWLGSEEIHLDVDGNQPQMMVSGTIRVGLTAKMHWIAEVRATGFATWEGPIWYRKGSGTFMPYNHVKVLAVNNRFSSRRKATITFTGPNGLQRTRTYQWRSRYFRDVEFEYDKTTDAEPSLEVETCAHTNHPVALPCRTLTIGDAFKKSGINVKVSPGSGIVPISGAGSGGRWSDAELHDVMRTYWSKFSDRPQWAMWVMWCAQHEQGSGLGGKMFDDIGPNHRQGTAVFTDSFISRAPAGEMQPNEWVNRMRFWTAVHEMGHGFNLAHAWQKSHPPSWGNPWIPLVNEPESRSFMNYPFRVDGGEASFFADFDYSFSDQELLFLRHAPAEFVRMGDASWFDDHGFSNVSESLAPGLRLEARTHRIRGVAFEFLEPIVIEFKLWNEGSSAILLDPHGFEDGDGLTVVLRRRNGQARQWAPFSRGVYEPATVVLQPGEALYTSFNLSAGLNGSDLAEPGWYEISAAFHTERGVVTSDPFSVRVSAPRSYEEEDLAGDLCTDEVSRALTFGATPSMPSAKAALELVVERFPETAIALHARRALVLPDAVDFKHLDLGQGQADSVRSIAELAGKLKVDRGAARALTELQKVMLEEPDLAADTFGHLDFNATVGLVSTELAVRGKKHDAAECEKALADTLEARAALPSVVANIRSRATDFLDGGK